MSRSPSSLDIVILGLSITSSWGNGHATTYRHLVQALHHRGHRVLFLERDTPWYRDNRDLPALPSGELRMYDNLEQLRDNYAASIRQADLVILGSFVPEGIAVGRWITRHARGITAFYDIDTPVTLGKLAAGTCDYLEADQIAQFALYLSFTGGPVLQLLEDRFGSPMARPLYCSVDPVSYSRSASGHLYDLGYMGTYSPDRQGPLDRLLLQPARIWPQGRFVVAGSQYPKSIRWPAGVSRIDHVPPSEHASFYGSQRFTLNVTRREMIQLGYSPSIRLFEAAACGTAIISDSWAGLGEFFEIGKELLISRSSEQTLEYLTTLSDTERRQIGERARQRVLSEHTSEHRARQLEQYVDELAGAGGPSRAAAGARP